MSKIVDKKLLELTGKIKVLNFAIKKSDEVIDSTKTEVLTRQVGSITNRTSYTCLKEEIEEIKFTDNDSEENIRNWAEEIESRISEADNKVSEKRERLNEIKETERVAAEETERVAIDIKRQKRLELEKQKFELEQAAKDEERKRELKHKTELLNKQLEYQKSIETSRKNKKNQRLLNYPNYP